MEMAQIVNDFKRSQFHEHNFQGEFRMCPPLTLADLRAAIRRRAEEIYVRSGKIPGHDDENWAHAEREVQARDRYEASARAESHRRRVDGVEYIGEYRPEISAGYIPGEFGMRSSRPRPLSGGQNVRETTNGKNWRRAS